MDKNEILNMPVHTSKDWKFGLCTREVHRANEDTFEIDDTSSVWVTAVVTYQQMSDLLDGKLSLTELDWK